MQAVIADSREETLARQFLDFISRKESRPAFEKYGFRIIDG